MRLDRLQTRKNDVDKAQLVLDDVPALEIISRWHYFYSLLA